MSFHVWEPTPGVYHIRDAMPVPDEEKLLQILLLSRDVYEQYTAPLGLCWMVQPHEHYGPSPWGYEFQA